MELKPYADADIALTEAIECDPEMMAELGGARDPSEIPATHRRRVESTQLPDRWLKIVPKPGGPAAGVIGVWESEWTRLPIHEVGWMVLPAFQRRGVASQALELLLAQIREDPQIGRLHAFPGASNPASNALCRKFGFTLTEGAVECQYSGRPLRCNHWELALDA